MSYWVLVHIPSPELRWCLFLGNSFLPGVEKKGSWKMSCTQIFPLPPPALHVNEDKCICIWGGMCAGVGVTSKENRKVLHVLLCCRFYSSLKTSEILLISYPKISSCLAVHGRCSGRFGSYCLMVLHLQLLGCKHQHF